MTRIYDSQRLAYGGELAALGRENPRVVALEADLGKSTMSSLFGAEFPERYFEMGIAEQNMMSTAAGLAAAGKIAFAGSFAVFAFGRAYDQIRQTISIGRLNVKICGSSAGLSDFGDGSTHQAIEDVAVMCAVPNMTVFTPCDANETRKAVRAAAAVEGPVYIRVCRNPVAGFTSPDDVFSSGKLRVIRDGSDAAIFAHGVMLEAAADAAGELGAMGVSAMVVNCATMKPFDYAGCAELCSGMRAVVTAEEHTYIGGLASAVALSLRKSVVPMDYVAIMDEFGQSAHSAAELYEHYGLTSRNIVKKVCSLLHMPR
jgi:transketolase